MNENDMKFLTTRELARLWHVSEATIKRWADAGHLPANRTLGGHRRFALDEVVRFQNIRGLTVTAEARRELGVMREAAEAQPEVARDAESEFFDAIVRGHEAASSALLLESYVAGKSLAEILDGAVAGAMHRVGRLWHGGEISLVDEHLASRTTVRALEVLSRSVRREPSNGLSAFCCASEDELHDIAVLCVQIVLESEGWRVKNFGADTPFFALAEVVGKEGPDLLCISSTMQAELERSAREYAQLYEAARRRGTRIILGGEGFKENDVRRRFPADAHADNLRALTEFIEPANARPARDAFTV